MSKGLKAVPTVVQLPGGVKLQAIPFRALTYNDDGSPKTFEILPANSTAGGPGVWWLFADAAQIRSPRPEGKAQFTPERRIVHAPGCTWTSPEFTNCSCGAAKP